MARVSIRARSIERAMKKRIQHEIPVADTILEMNFNPDRSAWNGFPDVAIQADESAVKKHPDYPAAKSGDIEAAKRLTLAFIDENEIQTMRTAFGDVKPIVAAVQAIEEAGENVIPTAMGGLIAVRLGLELDDDIVQINRVGRTGSGGFYRLAIQPLFDGAVTRGRDYLLVDDFIGQGGTLANLKGHIEVNGGRAIF